MNELSQEIIGAAIEVHRELEPGLLEQTYEAYLFHEFTRKRLQVERQVVLPIQFKDQIVKGAYRIDLLVENEIIIELKSDEKLVSIHTASCSPISNSAKRNSASSSPLAFTSSKTECVT